jgi:hypothetical protein
VTGAGDDNGGVKAEDGTLSSDLWIDFQAEAPDGLTPALVEHARPGVTVEPGRYLVVGSDDSELAVARVVSVEPNGVVYTRVLPGPAVEHLHLVGGSSAA